MPTLQYAFDPIKAKMALGVDDVSLFGLGNSTLYGALDALWKDNYGWFGRFGILLGTYYNYNVDIYGFNTTTRVWEAPQVWGVGGVTGPSKIRIRNATVGGRPTLKLYHGGFPGYTLSALGGVVNGYSQFKAQMSGVDGIFLADWLNDYLQSVTAFASQYQAFVTSYIRPNVGSDTIIIVTTENASNRGYGPTGVANGIPRAFLNGVDFLPLTPVVQAGTSAWPKLFVQDSQQAYLSNFASNGQLNSDLVHPTAQGYNDQAIQMFNTLVLDPNQQPHITTDDLGALVRAIYYEKTIDYTGQVDSWSVSAGVVPHGMSFDAPNHKLYGTPSSFGGAYDLTIKAHSNDYGDDEKRYSGIIQPNGFPFIPTNPTQTLFLANVGGHEYWYKSKNYIKKPNGTWVPVVSMN